MEMHLTPIERLARMISNMVLILVMLLGTPPVVSIWERRRSPATALVLPLRGRVARGWPDHSEPVPPWPGPGPRGPTFPLPGGPPHGAPAPSEPSYLPVRAA